MAMSRTTRALIAATTLIVAVTIGIADATTGYLPEITIFILIPVIAGTYFLGFRYGVFVAIVAAAAELIAHLLLDPNSQQAVMVGSTISHTFIYILTAALIARLVKQLGTITKLEEQRSTDLDIAKRVHGSVFTDHPGSFRNLSIGRKVAFARELGGDYYFINSSKDRLFFCLADISGKSIAAALFAALLNQSVTEALERTSDLTDLLERVNFRIISAFPEDMFITMFCAFIYEDRIIYVNAGHPPPLLYLKGEESPKMFQSSHILPIGIVSDLRIEATTVPLRPGEIFLAITDGITESSAFRDRPLEKLAEVLSQNVAVEAQELVNIIYKKAVPDDTKSPLDDIIVVCIKRQPDHIRPLSSQ